MQGVPEILCNWMPEMHIDMACNCLDIDIFWKLNKPVWYTGGLSQLSGYNKMEEEDEDLFTDNDDDDDDEDMDL